MTHRIVIDPDGRIRFLYDDALREIMKLGEFVVNRASRVEPIAGGFWTADMSPVKGPVLGPFETRAAALDAEKAWIHANHMGLDPAPVDKSH